MEAFDREMEAQRERARAASKFGAVDPDAFEVDQATEFVGYEAVTGRLRGQEDRFRGCFRGNN